MAIKSWFRGGSSKQQAPQEYTIDDLIVLEKYDEASERLRARLSVNPNDLHSHLKLAEVYAQLQKFDKAVDEFGYVADEYASDGFYDKGIALLSKAMKLAPLDSSLRFKIEKLQREKGMEHVRSMALEGLQKAGGARAGTSAVELKKLWHHLAHGTLVQHLSGEQLKRLFSSMEYERLESGTQVVEEGSQNAFLLLIVIGVVEATIPDGGKMITVRSFTSGDILGDAALLERGSWPATYRTVEPVTALRLSRAGLEATLVGNPDPRGFLDVLREQHNDRDVAATIRRLRPVVEIDERLRKLAADMVETMHAAPGVGLAAPQVGVDLRLAVVDVTVGEDPSQVRILINPEIEHREGLETEVEGCLSLPGITDKVDRPAFVRLQATNLEGERVALEAQGYLARALCHELDHLDGILFTDHLRGLRKERARRQLKRLAAEREEVLV